MNDRAAQGALLRLLRDAVLIVALAALAGAAVNARLLRQVWSEWAPGAVAALDAGGGEELLPMPVSLEEMRSLPAGTTVLIDARSRDLYLLGHIPAARSLPWGEVEDGLNAFLDQVPRDRMLITYCSGYGCEDSFYLAQRLMAAGYADVRVFEGGMPEWQDAGLPVKAGQP